MMNGELWRLRTVGVYRGQYEILRKVLEDWVELWTTTGDDLGQMLVIGDNWRRLTTTGDECGLSQKIRDDQGQIGDKWERMGTTGGDRERSVTIGKYQER